MNIPNSRNKTQTKGGEMQHKQKTKQKQKQTTKQIPPKNKTNKTRSCTD